MAAIDARTAGLPSSVPPHARKDSLVGALGYFLLMTHNPNARTTKRCFNTNKNLNFYLTHNLQTPTGYKPRSFSYSFSLLLLLPPIRNSYVHPAHTVLSPSAFAANYHIANLHLIIPIIYLFTLLIVPHFSILPVTT
jgi:hypothetical protein